MSLNSNAWLIRMNNITSSPPKTNREITFEFIFEMWPEATVNHVSIVSFHLQDPDQYEMKYVGFLSMRKANCYIELIPFNFLSMKKEDFYSFPFTMNKVELLL